VVEGASRPDAPEMLARLDRLDVMSHRRLRGRMQGERRSPKKGQSVEFADYRPYTPGDDLRRVDWNLYARLDKLFIRLFMEEEDLTVSLLVDTSESMRFGTPEKLAHALRIAAALGYITLTHHNRLNLYTFGASITGSLTGLRGRAPVSRMADFLERAAAPRAGAPVAGDLEAALRRFALLERRPGIVVVLSDFLEKGDLDGAMRHLGVHRAEAWVLQLLSPEELDPQLAALAGELKLRDAEDAEAVEISVDPALFRQYRRTVEGWRQAVRRAATRRGARYLFGDTSVSVERIVLGTLRKQGLLG